MHSLPELSDYTSHGDAEPPPPLFRPLSDVFALSQTFDIIFTEFETRLGIKLHIIIRFGGFVSILILVHIMKETVT
jgi:hypothetical protein